MKNRLRRTKPARHGVRRYLLRLIISPLGKGRQHPGRRAQPDLAMQAAATKTGRDVGSLCAGMMVIADPATSGGTTTRAPTWARLSWMSGQGQRADPIACRLAVENISPAPEGAIWLFNFNMGTLVGYAPSAGPHARRSGDRPPPRTSCFTFDDFRSAWSSSVQRIQPLMKSAGEA